MADDFQPVEDQSLIHLGRGTTLHPSQVRWQFARGSGPGGQNVNKVNTRAELWVAVTDIAGLAEDARARLRQFAGKKLTKDDQIHIVAGEQRSQEMNRQAALVRLSELVVRAAKQPLVRRKTKPSKGAKRRRLESKRHRSEIKSRRSGPLE